MEITTVSLDKERRDRLAELRDEMEFPNYDVTVEYLLRKA